MGVSPGCGKEHGHFFSPGNRRSKWKPGWAQGLFFDFSLFQTWGWKQRTDFHVFTFPEIHHDTSFWTPWTPTCRSSSLALSFTCELWVFFGTCIFHTVLLRHDSWPFARDQGLISLIGGLVKKEGWLHPGEPTNQMKMTYKSSKRLHSFEDWRCIPGFLTLPFQFSRG